MHNVHHIQVTYKDAEPGLDKPSIYALEKSEAKAAFNMLIEVFDLDHPYIDESDLDDHFGIENSRVLITCDNTVLDFDQFDGHLFGRVDDVDV